MKIPLFVTGSGAVTPAGLTAPQTTAAFWAGLSAFSEILRTDEIGATQIAAQVPADWRLKRTDGEWLINMAARAVTEAMAEAEADPRHTVLFLAPPESFRDHPCYESVEPARFLPTLIEKLGHSYHVSSRAVDGGAAALVAVIEAAAVMIAERGVQHVVIAGVDSYINATDMARLAFANRLQGPENAQGVVPSEGAAAVVLSAQPKPGATAAIRGVGGATEQRSVLGEHASQGRGMQEALSRATGQPGTGEARVEFVISNGNGERYGALEALIYRSRFYRTHREYMATAYPAMTVGELGSAGAPLSLIVLRDAYANGYAPGRVAVTEVASESGARAAAFVEQAVRKAA